MKARKIYFLIILVFLPGILKADSGLPYLFGWGLQIIVLTLFVGLVESFVLKVITGHQVKSARIILGNYVSTIFGQAIIASLLYEYLDLYKYVPIPKRLGPFTNSEIGILTIAFIITFFIEYPFVRWSLPKENRERKTVIKAVMLANIVSYIIIVLYYLWALNWMYYNRTN